MNNKMLASVVAYFMVVVSLMMILGLGSEMDIMGEEIEIIDPAAESFELRDYERESYKISSPSIIGDDHRSDNSSAELASEEESDTDLDGNPDSLEVENKLNPPDAHEDSDGDNITNLEEFENGTDPTDAHDHPTSTSKSSGGSTSEIQHGGWGLLLLHILTISLIGFFNIKKRKSKKIYGYTRKNTGETASIHKETGTTGKKVEEKVSREEIIEREEEIDPEYQELIGEEGPEDAREHEEITSDELAELFGDEENTGELVDDFFEISEKDYEKKRELDEEIDEFFNFLDDE